MQEWFAAGAIGEVREVHVWTNRPLGSGRRACRGRPRRCRCRSGMDWDLWLGAAPPRPFHKTYHPSFWRAWQDFGAGAMGDMACHVMDASYTVLKLGAADEHHRDAGRDRAAAARRPARLGRARRSTTTAIRRRRSSTSRIRRAATCRR